jgi:hypothetical protein
MVHLVMLVIFYVDVIFCQNFNLPHIYRIFAEKTHFWDANYSHGIQTWFILCEMKWFYISSTFIKIKNHLNCFWSIFVFLNTHVHYIHFHKCIPISHFIKWNGFFSNLLPRLYSNIICKNIVKIFQKLEVGYIQTCTSFKSTTMWHPKGGHCNVLFTHQCALFEHVGWDSLSMILHRSCHIESPSLSSLSCTLIPSWTLSSIWFS